MTIRAMVLRPADGRLETEGVLEGITSAVRTDSYPLTSHIDWQIADKEFATSERLQPGWIIGSDIGGVYSYWRIDNIRASRSTGTCSVRTVQQDLWTMSHRIACDMDRLVQYQDDLRVDVGNEILDLNADLPTAVSKILDLANKPVAVKDCFVTCDSSLYQSPYNAQMILRASLDDCTGALSRLVTTYHPSWSVGLNGITFRAPRVLHLSEAGKACCVITAGRNSVPTHGYVRGSERWAVGNPASNPACGCRYDAIMDAGRVGLDKSLEVAARECLREAQREGVWYELRVTDWCGQIPAVGDVVQGDMTDNIPLPISKIDWSVNSQVTECFVTLGEMPATILDRTGAMELQLQKQLEEELMRLPRYNPLPVDTGYNPY